MGTRKLFTNNGKSRIGNRPGYKYWWFNVNELIINKGHCFFFITIREVSVIM